MEFVTHLRVQKLLYFAQAWHLLLLDRPLFEEDMQAWAHGPVAPSVYQAFTGNGWNALPIGGDDSGIEGESLAVLDQVKLLYGEFSAKKLEAITHSESPWVDARGDLSAEARCSTVIKKDAIQTYYQCEYGKFLIDDEEDQ